MNVVDSSAWLSYFAGDANSDVFSKAIEDIDHLIVPSITITEVFKCILRQRSEDLDLTKQPEQLWVQMWPSRVYGGQPARSRHHGDGIHEAREYQRRREADQRLEYENE